MWNSNPRILRSMSIALHRTVNPLPLVCWPACQKWMSSNQLKLNASKTEFIWIGTRQQLSKLRKKPWWSVALMVKVRNLVVFIDREQTMEDHVSNSGRQLHSIKRSLTFDSRLAFVASPINYCNDVLYGAMKGEVQRLQTVVNAAARLVVSTEKNVTSSQFMPSTGSLYDIDSATNRQTRSRNCIHGIDWSGLFWWRLCPSGWRPWTIQPAFSDTWRSFDPSNTKKIGRTEFPNICINGVELTSVSAQTFFYMPRTFLKRNENILV